MNISNQPMIYSLPFFFYYFNFFFNRSNINRGKMAGLSHQPKLSRKRALDAMAPRQKRAKGYIESINDEADANAAAPITSICNELIDRIFDFLDGKSLLNVRANAFKSQQQRNLVKNSAKNLLCCIQRHRHLRSASMKALLQSMD